MDQANRTSFQYNKEETSIYSQVLTLLQPQKHNENIKLILPEIKEKWKDYFTFTQNGALEVRPARKEEFYGKHLVELITDIATKAKAYNIQDLDNLSFDFPKSKQLTGNDLKQFAESIVQHFPKLHKLSLNFTECSSIVSDTGLFDEFLSIVSQNFKYLQQLALHFAKCGLKDESIVKLGSHIAQHLKTLIQLTLDFNGYFKCKELSDKAIIDMTSEICSSLENLWRLTLDFGNNNIREESFLKVCLSITEHSRDLEQLSLSFAECPGLDDSQFINIITEISQNLSALKELSLSFYACQGITEVGIKDLDAIIMDKFSHLTKLNLDFGLNTKITEQAAVQLNFNIVHNLKGLRDLGLGFRGILSAENANKVLSDITEYNPSLQRLSLDFTNCQINDEVLREFASNINQRSKELQSLSLNLNNNNITDDGLRQFATEITQYKNKIQAFSLHLVGCDKITDDLVKWTKNTLSFIPYFHCKLSIDD